MRHNFVNDIGDYVKYALLRAMCRTSDVPLGVIWYLTVHAEMNGDGRRRPHLSRDGWDGLDSELLAKMREIEAGLNGPEELDLSLIEKSAVLPPGTVFFSEPLPEHAGSIRERMEQRTAWFARARQSVGGCGLLFLDPDNGLEVSSVKPGSRLAGKYATAAEIAALLTDGAAVVLYQHCDRSAWTNQRTRIGIKLRSEIGASLAIRSVRFGAFGSRAFFCISNNSTTTAWLDQSIDVFTRGVSQWAGARYFLIE